jgi:hypothetical protein
MRKIPHSKNTFTTDLEVLLILQNLTIFRWCHSNFSLTSFRTHYGLGVDSASNRNEYQEYFLGGKGGQCVALTTFMCGPSRKLGVSTSWNPQGPSRAAYGLFYIFRILGAELSSPFRMVIKIFFSYRNILRFQSVRLEIVDLYSA